MKRFVILILYNLLAFFIYAGVIPFQGLRERIARDPEGSLLLLDSLEEKGTIPQYGIDYLRALSYRTQSTVQVLHVHALCYPRIEQSGNTARFRAYFIHLYAFGRIFGRLLPACRGGRHDYKG